MEEPNKENKKKSIILTVIGLITLIGFVIGASFAYYNITTNNGANKTNVTGGTEGLGVAAIYNPTPSLHIRLSTADMSLSNVGKTYYATNDDSKNYDAEENKRSIAVAGVTGGEENVKFQCESTLEIELSGTMKDALVSGDGSIILTPTDNIEMDETTLDLKDLASKSPIEIPITYKLTGPIEGSIKATMAINNTSGNQLPLTGKELNVNITNKTFKCETVQEFSEGPIISKFYINEESDTAKVTEDANITLHLTWNSSRVTDYCILEDNNNVDNCNWKDASGVQEITENYTFTSSATKTFYAYLRNAKGVSLPKSDVIEYKEPNYGPTEVAEDELATRYYGTNPPNYICFGTTNKSTCTGDTDKYMYRIIGVDKSGRYKVIKKEALNAGIQWYSNYTTDKKWPDSTIYSQINGSAFLTNSTYMPSGWSDKIETINWKYGDLTDVNKTAAQMVQKEQAWTTTTNAQIGLMYLADYYYGLSKTGVNCSYNSSSTYPQCKTSWMHLKQNDTGAPNANAEWTMSRYGRSGGYYAWYVYSGGNVYDGRLDSTYSVRPVFYLKSNITIDGTGTQTDPYMIIN